MSQNLQTLSQWLEYIESLHPSHIELGLERVRAVARRLQVDRFDVPVVTVTGTNGKGSAIAAMEAIGCVQNLKTAAYTSPHLLRFNERLRVSGKEISDLKWVEAFKKVERAREAIELTYFEFTTLAALCLTKDSNPDLILLEVGLGGRLDAVNVVDNQCAIITSVDYDHQEWLGETLEQIAFEKSGIVRENAPVVVANPKVASLVEPHLPKGASLHIAVTEVPSIAGWNAELVKKYKNIIYPDSLACALVALTQLGIMCKDLDQALGSACLPGRWQQLSGRDHWWFDVAHNPQAIANLASKLKEVSHIRRWTALCGMLKDKRAIQTMSYLKDVVDNWVLVPTSGPRGQSAQQLAERLSELQLTAITHCESVAEAIEIAEAKVDEESAVIVFGSFIVVANVIEYLQQTQ